MMLRKKLFLLIFLGVSLPSFTMPPVIEKMGIEKGLSDNYILCVAQDKNGCMWFGTEWGLNKFDGYVFKNYKTHSLNNNTVSSNGINKILADKDENIIWIATKSGGLNVFDCSTQQFNHYPVSSDEPNSTKSNGITDLCFSEGGNIWIATYNNGLKKLDKKSNTITHLNSLNLPQLKDYKIKCIADDMNGNLYIGHWGEGFSILSTKNNTIKFFEHNPDDPHSLPGNEVLDMCIDSRGRIWLATHKGLALYNPGSEKFTIFKHNKENPFSLSSDDIHSICEVNNSLWIGTWRGGVSILDLSTKNLSSPEDVHFDHIRPSDSQTGLSSSSIVEIFGDSYGNVWMGTYGEGLNIIKHIEPYFNTLSYSPIRGDDNGLSDKIVSCISYDPLNQLWVGTANGNVDVYKGGNKVQHYSKANNKLPGNDIISSLADGKGNIWLGVDRNGLMRLNKHKNIFEKIKLTEKGELYQYITCIYEDKSHNIWIGTHDGLLRYNPATNEIKEQNLQKAELPYGLITSIFQDVNGNYWIGSRIYGLSLTTPEFDLIRKFSLESDFISNNINYIYQDSDNRIWIATADGLATFPSVASKKYDFDVLGQSNGIPDNNIRAIVEGKKGEMWITTNAGITKFSVKDKHIENYDFHDGIPWGTFINAAVAKAPDGTVFFGSQNGICYFNSNINPGNYKIPPVVITNFSIYDTEGIQSNHTIDMPISPGAKLKYDQNTFTIDFSIMDYALKDRIEYAYFLEGVDNAWYETKGQNQVTFRNISPGKYIFHIKSRIRNQEWSTNITSLKVEIDPPFWFSWWAKTLYSLILISIITGIIWFYKRRLFLENQLYLEKQNHLQEQELNDEKLRFYTNITHELKTPLTLIIGPLGDLTEDKLMPGQAKKISLIHKSAIRLSNLINQIMEFSKSETHNRILSVSFGNISGLIQEIILKYKELNQNKDISVNMFLEADPLLYYDSEVITIILDNIISNALKYTKEGYVSVILREVSSEEIRYMEIEVCDTGYGMPKEVLDKIFDRYYQVKGEYQASGTGIGLALVQNMVKLHEGSISVESKINKGTSFYFRLKIDNDYPDALHDVKEELIIEKKSDFAPLLLVIEDNEDIKDYISDSLSDSFEIITAKDGKEGLKLAIEKIPDIIISDIMMPVMTGTELCRTLKEDMRTSHIPIILLTAKDSEKDKTEGYLAGADSYITKPFSANLLKTRAINLLQGREKVAKYFSTDTYKKVVSSNSLNQLDNEFVEKTISIIEDNMQSEQINVTFLAEQVHMSYSSFSRKMKALTGMTVNELVRKIKMQHAEQLLLSRKYTVSEVVFLVGYNSMAYFREAFKSEFGVLPSNYLKDLGKINEDSNEN